MSEFSRNLKEKVERSFGKKPAWDGVNPLVVIGLTEAMLDVGLNEEQMYRVVKSYSRQLAGQIHPDRKAANISEERQRQIIEAFDILDNRATFSKALSEFRTLKSGERSEIRVLRDSLVIAQEKLYVAQSREPELMKGLAELQREREIFDREEADLRVQIPLLNREIHELSRKNSIHMRQRIYWKARADRVTSYIQFLGANKARLDGDTHVFDAQWVVLASLVPEQESVSRHPPQTAISEAGRFTPGFLEASVPLGITKATLDQISERWVADFPKFSTPTEGSHQKTYRLTLTLLKLSAGKPEFVYGWRAPFLRGRFIGSLSPHRVQVGREQLTHLTSKDTMLAWLMPSVTLGGIAVFADLLKVEKYLDGSFLQFPKFDTKHVIMGVG